MALDFIVDALPATLHSRSPGEGTGVGTVVADDLVLGYQLERESLLTAVLPVAAGTLEFARELLQGQVPGLQEVLLAGGTVLQPRPAGVTYVVTTLAQCYRRQHVF